MCQRRECSSNIELRSAGDAYVKMWKMKVNELLDKRENLFTRRWDSGPVWALVNRVKDNVNRPKIGNREHIFETLYHNTIAGLLCTILVSGIKVGEDIATRARLCRELNEEGRKEVATVLFLKVPEVEIKVHYQSRPRFSQIYDASDDCRTKE